MPRLFFGQGMKGAACYLNHVRTLLGDVLGLDFDTDPSQVVVQFFMETPHQCERYKNKQLECWSNMVNIYQSNGNSHHPQMI